MAEVLVQEYYTWSGSTEIGAIVENASILRKVQLPSSWQTAKLSVRCILSGSDGNIPGPRMYLGLCSGSNVVGDPTVDYFIGLRTSDASVTYNSSSFSTYYSVEAAQGVVFDGGSTPVSISADLYSAVHIIGAVGPLSHAVFKPAIYNLIISRSLDQDILRILPGIFQTTAPWDKTTFLKDLQTPDVTTYVSNGVTYAFSASAERANTLDTVLFAWDKENPYPAVMVLDIGVSVWEN